MVQAMKGFRHKPAGSSKRFLAGLLFFMASSAFAQDSAAEKAFSPYVSHLAAETRNNLVRLSWIDSSDARGPVYIFRSTHLFSDTSGLRPTQVNYGSQLYVDETDGFGTVYYFVAASDVQGQRYDTFIPYTNTTTVVFSQAPRGEPAVPIQAVETLRAGDSVISGLMAHTQGEGIIISFALSGTGRNPVLYRSNQPIHRVQDLLSSIIVQTGISSPFIDYPAPGSSYYYALVFEDDITGGVLEIQPGRNATIEAVEIAGKAQENTPLARAIPLPTLSIYKASPGSDFYSGLPSPASPLLVENLETTRKEQPAPPPLKRPRVFARDLESPGGGEESILQTIVQGPFVQREWQSARDQLLRFLALPRSRASEARAHFYLGQTYYYNGRNRDALLEFLIVQSTYPDEANEWIEAVLGAFSK
jgi:hypothetical protein